MNANGKCVLVFCQQRLPGRVQKVAIACGQRIDDRTKRIGLHCVSERTRPCLPRSYRKFEQVINSQALMVQIFTIAVRINRKQLRRPESMSAESAGYDSVRTQSKPPSYLVYLSCPNRKISCRSYGVVTSGFSGRQTILSDSPFSARK